MLPLFLKKNTKSFNHSFEISRAKVSHTYDKWHNHIELEFLHILKGKGTRYIGDSIEEFNDGDLVLVGSHLAHVWRCDKSYYEKQSELSAEVILIHFLEDFVGKDFLSLPEMQHVKELLHTAKQGIQVIGKTQKKISAQLQLMVDMPPTERLIELVKVLNTIAQSGEYKVLSSMGFVESYKSHDSDRIDRVYDYIFNNFSNDVSLEKVAGIANMNTSAFCRYFKASTFKSFTQVLNDVRVGYACKLLLHGDMGISAVGYSCGFNNISYFIKTFKRSQGITPLEFQKKHQEQ